MQTFCGDLGIFYEGLAVKETNGKWFYILEDGTLAHQECFEMAEYFQNGLAWVKKNGKWIRINKQGEEVQMKNTSSVK